MAHAGVGIANGRQGCKWRFPEAGQTFLSVERPILAWTKLSPDEATLSSGPCNI